MEEKKEFKDKPSEITDRIAEANVAAARLEKANTEKERLLKLESDLRAEQILSGTSEAGSEPKTKSQEEKEIEGARNLLKGTGYDEQLFPKKGDV